MSADAEAASENAVGARAELSDADPGEGLGAYAVNSGTDEATGAEDKVDVAAPGDKSEPSTGLGSERVRWVFAKWVSCLNPVSGWAPQAQEEQRTSCKERNARRADVNLRGIPFYRRRAVQKV